MLLKRKHLFGTTILAGLMAAAAPAVAQESQLPGVEVRGEDRVDEIVVTGTRIRRDPANSPTPLIQVGGEALRESGLPTVVDYLATIPALSNSLVPSDTTGSNLNDGGLEFANLRSLGSGRTLTLVDGRRHVGSARGNLAVDVSVIPRLLIENIEIITGGASSVYGADAVSGVVNYVLRRDFEGLEFDINYGQLVQGGDAVTRRVSVLAGANLLDDRLNIYVHGEYEKADEVYGEYLNWMRDSRIVLGVDADPSNPAIGPINDGFIDNAAFFGARRLDRPRWGSTTLANMQQPSRLTNPLVPYLDCPGASTSGNCFNVAPGYTWWYDGPTARLANFGQRIGNVGANRPWNIGGDGEPANYTSFNQRSYFPEQEAQRYQAGLNFRVTDNITARFEVKYTTEDTFDVGQPSFFDIFVSNFSLAAGTGTAITPGYIQPTSAFSTRLDNAFLPANVAAAIANNTFTRYGAPTANADGAVIATNVAAAIAKHNGFSIDRPQENNREITRYVAALEGSLDSLLFLRDFNWGVSYVYGEMNNVNREYGHDAIRLGHALDAVVDTAGIVNGRPGEIVCRVQKLHAEGRVITEQNPYTATTVYTDAGTNPEVAGCVPLNVFGNGNQSAEGLEYITAWIAVREKNIQENAQLFFAGSLWDFWGAGPIGVALGAEWRREYTEGVGRDRDRGTRALQVNTGVDFPGAEYESEEIFAELSIPLLRDSWLGEYAELSGSFRRFDYTTAGTGDVYGVNLVYRPIRDITLKGSFNTSFRAPNLGENFAPFSQTFFNGFVDPCDARVIANFTGADAVNVRANRIANCSALAAAKGVSYNFADPLAANAFLPTYAAGVAGVNGGNPFLKPETSESLTISAVIQPRFFPNLTLILDYYEIRIDDVIAAVTAQVAANRCVSGPGLDTAACNTIFRSNPTTGDAYDNFKVGAASGDPIGGFIQGSVNYAALETRGLDFTLRYVLDTEETFGLNWGTFRYELSGLWLIEQKQYTNVTDPSFYTDLTTGVYYPRLEGVSRLTWIPNSTWSMTWTVDWMGSQDLNQLRDITGTGNLDVSPRDWWTTGNFFRHDLNFRYRVRDDLTLRFGVTNLFDAEPPIFLGFASTFDPYGRRFNIGLNYRPF